MYDGDLGTLPAQQGWLYFTDPFPPLGNPLATQEILAAAVLLDTSPRQSDAAGYFSVGHPGVPILDRNVGFAVGFDVRIDQESHASTHRAGSSVIVLSQDLYGVEVGFWEDEIWVQSGPDFLHAEGTAFDTTVAEARYRLIFLDSRYYLIAEGAIVLEGDLRNYSAFGFPYNTPNFLFFGDDTSSASARIELGFVEISGIDYDNDGLSDIEEDEAGTDLYDSDTDGDGHLDGVDPDPLDSLNPVPAELLPGRGGWRVILGPN